MAIFNEAFLDRFKKSKDKKKSDTVNDFSSNKSKGVLTQKDIQDAGTIIQEIGADSKDIDASYMFERSPDEAYKEYSKSKSDKVWICTYFSTKVEDVDDFDLFAPGATSGSSIRDKKMKDGAEKFKTAVNREIAKKHSGEFNIVTSESSEAMFFYINSLKPKTTSTNEAAEWHGKYFLSKEELHDPKFRSSQFKKVHAIIRNCLKSESFNKEFTAVPSMYDYFEDDDSNDVLKKWTYESKKSRVLSMCYFPDKLSREDGSAKESADFIMKAFEKAKRDDPKNTFGKLKYDEDHGQIDYKL